MIGSLYTGISGLNGFQNALNTESNNISNVNTVGYKADAISFADQMYQTSIGKGMTMETVDKDFSQGNLKFTNNEYDMAVKGKGFFMVTGETNEVFYTRSGNFRVTEDGTLRLPNDYQIQGLSATSNTVLSTNGDKIFTTDYTEFIASQTIQSATKEVVSTINSRVSDYISSAQDDLDIQKGNSYKTKEAKIADINALAREYRDELSIYSTLPTEGEAATKQVSNISFDKSKLNTLIDSVEITIGTKTFRQAFTNDATTTLQLFADKISSTELLNATIDNSGKLVVTSMVPGKSIKILDAKVLNGAAITSPIPLVDTTNAIIGSGKARLDSIENELKIAIENADAKYLKISSTVDSTNIQNKAVGELQLKLDALNISESPFGATEVEDGIIYVRQDNNRFVIGKIVTAVFTNEYGLNPQGDNLYAKTAESGIPRFGTLENKILSKTLELSNSELSDSLVNLMVYQRAFEASSKSVTTSDEFLKTALALKK